MGFFVLHLILAFLLYSTAWTATVRETLRFTWEEGAPNGQSRKLIYTNGQFPGPPLIFTEGDDAEITVINDMPRNVTVHWHGVAQTGTPWSDGVIGLSQTPILPGEKYLYKFKATPVGSHWYHSHERMSITDGLYGALLIKPKEDPTELWSLISNDTDDIKAISKAAANPELLVVSDWTRLTSEEYWKVNIDSGLQVFCVDSLLINGMGSVYCPPMALLDAETAPNIKKYGFNKGQTVSDKGCFPFTYPIEGGPWNYTQHPERIPPHVVEGCVPSTGKNATIEVDPADGWVSLNFISAATVVQFVFSIDEHDFWIYEIDGNYVMPRKYVAATMSAGETFSAMVKLDKTPGVYTIRVPDSGATQVISGFAELVYKGSDCTSKPPSRPPSEPYVSYGGMALSNFTTENSYTPYDFNTDHMAPWPASVRPRPGPADEEYLLLIGRLDASTNYTMNTKYMYPPDFKADHPLLFNPNATLGTVDENLVVRTKNGSWVDIIFQVSTIPGDLAAFEHFMHKHGSKTWRIGFGNGVWNYSSVAEGMKARPQDFNLDNPGYRDSWLTQFSPVPMGGYWSVFRYLSDNPGPWLFHCHIELHQMGGMSIAILDGVDVWPEVPPEYQIGGGGGCKKRH